MLTKLKAVNDCLAIMGEAPLTNLDEEHAFKSGALDTLDRVDESVQAEDWWFNMENLRLETNPADHRIYFPTDTATLVPLWDRPNIVQRGRVLYDLKRGTDRFDDGASFEVVIRRRLALEELPNAVAAYIRRRVVMEFQDQYDGDQTKQRNLKAQVYGDPQVGTIGLRGLAVAEHIRNRKVNFIQNSPGLNRVRRVTHRRV